MVKVLLFEFPSLHQVIHFSTMALSAVTFKLRQSKQSELATMSEEQPLEDEEIEEKNLERLDSRLFVATTGKQHSMSPWLPD